MEIVREDAGGHRIAGGVRFASADAPLEGRGLDEVGLFAYSLAEIDDRLALVAAAVNHPRC